MLRALATRGSAGPGALRVLSRARPLVRARPLSGAPPPPPPSPTLVSQTVAGLAAGLNQYGPAVGLGVSGLVVVYGVSSLAWTVGGSFMSLTLKDALYWGFASGFLSAGLLGAGALRGYRASTLRTQPVFNLALAKLRKDERVAAALGATIQPGTLKAYDRVPGHVSTTKLAWVDPRVQMIFQVVGTDTGREAMVRGLGGGGAVGGGGAGEGRGARHARGLATQAPAHFTHTLSHTHARNTPLPAAPPPAGHRGGCQAQGRD